MSAHHGWNGTKGVAFVELIVAFFIFVVAGSGVLGAYLSSSQLSEEAASTMRAVNDLEDLMERIRATPFNSLLTNFPNGVPNGGGTNYATLVGGYALDSEQIVVTYPSQTPGRAELLATVTWTQRGRARSASLSTVRTSG